MAEVNLKISVVHAPDENEPFCVIHKPAGLPSAPLNEGDDSALTQALKLFPQLNTVAGRKPVEKGLLHRIDTATEGLLLIASTQDSFDKLQLQQKNGQFIKFYSAIVEYSGPLQHKTFTIQSRFRPYGPKGKEVRPVFEDGTTADKKKCGNKIYTTKINLDGCKALCSISEGYRHQVRAHLAFSGYPIKGDSIYNQTYKTEIENGKQPGKMFFAATRIDFINPADGKAVSFKTTDYTEN